MVDNLYQYDYIPDETLAYYKDQIDSGKRPLMFYRMPHVIYKGNIETKNLEIITI